MIIARVHDRQFIVLSAGGHAVPGAAPLGDFVVAVALPFDQSKRSKD